MFTRLTAADSQAVVPRDRYDLVRLYLWENNWNAANEQFLHLLGMPGGNRPEYLAAFVSALIQHDEYNDAGIWLARLERLAPHQLKTAGVKAKLAFSQKRYKEAINVIANYVADPASEPSDPATRLSEGAAYLELFASLLKSEGPAGDETSARKFIAETEFMLRQYIRKRPEDALQLGRFFGRQGQIEDALKLVKSTWKESDAVTVAQTLKAILCNAATTEAQAKQGEAILRAAMEKFNEPVGFLVVIAEAQTYQGNYGEAEGYYRQILKENPKQPLALNNLAVLLAIQKKSLHEALRLIDRAIGVSGPEPAMLDSKACVLMASGKPEAALQILDRAIKDRPTAIRCFHQAQAYDQAGQTSNAAAALKRADELDLTPKRLLPTEREALVRLRKKLL